MIFTKLSINMFAVVSDQTTKVYESSLFNFFPDSDVSPAYYELNNN